jgi:hypothetical protein
VDHSLIVLTHRLLRNIHLAATPFLGAFVYAGLLRENPAFVSIVQWGVFPLLAIAGMVMLIRPWLSKRADTKTL